MSDHRECISVIHSTVQERDAARAEVQRLKAYIDTQPHASDLDDMVQQVVAHMTEAEKEWNAGTSATIEGPWSQVGVLKRLRLVKQRMEADQ